MGNHGFSDTPSQIIHLELECPELTNQGLFGIAQGWDMPVAIWQARKGFDAYYPGNTHNTLSFILHGASIQRRDGIYSGSRGYADSDSFMLYCGGGSRRYSSEGDVRLCQIYFQSSLFQCAATLELEQPIDGLELRDDRIFARDVELRRLLDCYVSRAVDSITPPSLLEMDAYAVLFGLHLLRHHSNRAGPYRPAVGCLSPRYLAKVLDYIEAHIAENLALAQLAAMANLSPHHFCNVFRCSTGLAPHKYVTMRRVEHAKQLLAGTTPLTEIALDCGFSSQQHFTSTFRRIVGLTPGAFRASTRH